MPHLIALIQSDYNKLFSVLRSIDELSSHIQAFVSAFLNDAMDQLEGQVASARIALSALSSPNLFYVLSGNDFKLNINDPADPKILCIGSNPQRQLVYGAVISLYVTRMAKIINKPDQLPCFLACDEFPQFYFPGIEGLLATGRSRKLAVILGAQDLSMLRQAYGRDQADMMFNIPGNLVAGQSNGETARFISERIGRIRQPKQSVSSNSKDTSTSQSEQLDYAVPVSKISSLSSGEFVGLVADDPDRKMQLKAFHCEVQADFEKINEQEKSFEPLPVVRKLSQFEVQDDFNAVHKDVENILTTQLDKMSKSPALSRLIIKKKADSFTRKPKNSGE